MEDTDKQKEIYESVQNKFKGGMFNRINDSFLVLVALEGPAKVLNQMKNTLQVIAGISTLFIGVTVPLVINPGEFSNEIAKNMFGALVVTSTLMSFNASIISTFMYVQCELCDVTDSKMQFLQRFSKHDNMFIMTSTIWSFSGIVLSLPAMVIKVSDSYGGWMTLYFSALSLVLLYSLHQLIETVITKRIRLQKERFDSVFNDYNIGNV